MSAAGFDHKKMYVQFQGKIVRSMWRGSKKTPALEAQHAFMNEARPEVYDPACTKTAWDRTLKFLKTALT
jgi:dienelactone hydrolase